MMDIYFRIVPSREYLVIDTEENTTEVQIISNRDDLSHEEQSRLLNEQNERYRFVYLKENTLAKFFE